MTQWKLLRKMAAENAGSLGADIEVSKDIGDKDDTAFAAFQRALKKAFEHLGEAYTIADMELHPDDDEARKQVRKELREQIADNSETIFNRKEKGK